jgi:hypothetical protein
LFVQYFFDEMAASSSSSAYVAAAGASTETFIATQKQEYLALCRRLNLDAENERAAWNLLERFYETGNGVRFLSFPVCLFWSFIFYELFSVLPMI